MVWDIRTWIIIWIYGLMNSMFTSYVIIQREHRKKESCFVLFRPYQWHLFLFMFTLSFFLQNGSYWRRHANIISHPILLSAARAWVWVRVRFRVRVRVRLIGRRFAWSPDPPVRSPISHPLLLHCRASWIFSDHLDQNGLLPQFDAVRHLPPADLDANLQCGLKQLYNSISFIINQKKDQLLFI